MLSKIVQILKKGFAISLIILAMFLFLEITVRIFFPQDISPTIAELDDVLGYKLKPNITAVHKTSEFETIIKTSSNGYRSPEISYEKTNMTRILFLGDSFTYGWGVNEEERFSDIVSKTLDYEMLNAGVPGYKLSNILAYYETEGYKYNADIVVLAYNLRTGIVNINSKEYEVVNGTLIKDSLYTGTFKNEIKQILVKIPCYSFLSQHSQFFSFFRSRIVGFLQKEQVIESFQDCSVLQQQWNLHNKDREVLIIQNFNNLMNQSNITFVLVLLPVTSCNTSDIFIEFKNATPVTIIDLNPLFDNNTTSYYYLIDQHWNPQGHKFAAEILTSVLSTFKRTSS